MMLKHFFDISTGFRFKKNGKEFSVHGLEYSFDSFCCSATIPDFTYFPGQVSLQEVLPSD